jgi:hypothetical protein
MKNDSNEVILITSPHGLCPPSSNVVHRQCDLLATKAAELCSRYNGQWIRPDVYRTKADLNRDIRYGISRSHDEYMETIKRFHNEKQRYFVLDVHSFPNNSNAWNLSRDDPEMVILELDGNASESQAVAMQLKSKDIDVVVLAGSLDNAILRNALSYEEGMGLLVEFNEALEYNRLLLCVQTLMQWINER